MCINLLRWNFAIFLKQLAGRRFYETVKLSIVPAVFFGEFVEFCCEGVSKRCHLEVSETWRREV